MSAEWSIAPDVAYVDADRVVAVSLSDPTTCRPQVLQGTAAAIWRALASRREDAIIRAVADTYGVDMDEVAADVRAFLIQLEKAGLARRST